MKTNSEIVTYITQLIHCYEDVANRIELCRVFTKNLEDKISEQTSTAKLVCENILDFIGDKK